jgi:hypothetical protein
MHCVVVLDWLARLGYSMHTFHVNHNGSASHRDLRRLRKKAFFTKDRFVKSKGKPLILFEL